MTPRLFVVGEHETLKAGVHAGALMPFLVIFGYSAVAWWYRRERHLAFNFVVSALVIWKEVRHVREHLAAADAARAQLDQRDHVVSEMRRNANGRAPESSVDVCGLRGGVAGA